MRETTIANGRRARGREWQQGRWLFHHGDVVRSVPDCLIEVIGHIHPAIAWSDGAGLRLKVPVLVQSPRRLILPSFSNWSSGATWNKQVQEDEKLWFISARRIWPIGWEHFQRGA